MIDVNTFLLILLCVLGSILLVTLIVLVVKLIRTIDRINDMVNDINLRIEKFDRMFRIVDVLTDHMSIISDKLVDGISELIRKIFYRKKRKEEDINEQ